MTLATVVRRALAAASLTLFSVAGSVTCAAPPDTSVPASVASYPTTQSGKLLSESAMP